MFLGLDPIYGMMMLPVLLLSILYYLIRLGLLGGRD